VSGRQISVLPAGITVERVAPGLFEMTHATEDGVTAGLMGMWDLQALMDDLSGGPAG
jgi:hypothetical protein